MALIDNVDEFYQTLGGDAELASHLDALRAALNEENESEKIRLFSALRKAQPQFVYRFVMFIKGLANTQRDKLVATGQSNEGFDTALEELQKELVTLFWAEGQQALDEVMLLAQQVEHKASDTDVSRSIFRISFLIDLLVKLLNKLEGLAQTKKAAAEDVTKTVTPEETNKRIIEAAKKNGQSVVTVSSREPSRQGSETGSPPRSPQRTPQRTPPLTPPRMDLEAAIAAASAASTTVGGSEADSERPKLRQPDFSGKAGEASESTSTKKQYLVLPMTFCSKMLYGKDGKPLDGVNARLAQCQYSVADKTHPNTVIGYGFRSADGVMTVYKQAKIDCRLTKNGGRITVPVPSDEILTKLDMKSPTKSARSTHARLTQRHTVHAATTPPTQGVPVYLGTSVVVTRNPRGQHSRSVHTASAMQPSNRRG